MNDLLFDIDEVLTPAQIVELARTYDSGVFHSVGAWKRRRLDQSVASEHSILSAQEARTAPPPWMIGFSKQFKKDTSAMDRRMMGRILEVLEELTDYDVPFQARGDTFKPLTGELEGCWRYRIGDSRLVVQPQIDHARINALAFGARGSIYD